MVSPGFFYTGTSCLRQTYVKLVTLVLHHTVHFFSGFIPLPAGHLKVSENSFKFESVPMTLKIKENGGERLQYSERFLDIKMSEELGENKLHLSPYRG